MYYTADFVAFDFILFFSQGLNEAAKGPVCANCLRMVPQRTYAKVCIILMKWNPGRENIIFCGGGGRRFRAWKKKKHFKERGEQTGGGWNFERSVAGKTMRKEGLGTVGLLQDVVSGRQEYRKTAREETCWQHQLFYIFCEKWRGKRRPTVWFAANWGYIHYIK